jgi:hypothetical protein
MMAQEFTLQTSPRGNPALLHSTVPHYDFGLWVPIPTFGGGNTGMTGTHFSTYQRIGNRVYIDTDFTLSAKGSSVGAAEIYGLPFGSWGNLPPFKIAWFNMTSTLVNVTGVLGLGSAGLTAIILYGLAAAGASLIALADTDFADNTRITCSGFYTIEQG